jgi:hypothetical protein
MDCKVLGSPKKRRDASFMRMLKKDVLGEEQKKEAESEEKDQSKIRRLMEKDNILGFIDETKHGFHVMNKALGYHVGKKNMDAKQMVALSETNQLRKYLKNYGKEYKSKYANFHFSSAPGYAPKVELVNELFSDEEEKEQYMVDAGARIRV